MKTLYRLCIRHTWFFIYGFVKSFFLKKKTMTEPIDFVVTWVDGNDPEWQAEKRKYDQATRDKEIDKDNEAERYRDWGLFHYWFRAVEKYAPWVNKVYLVTCGQVPSWLNLDNPKLVIVNHTDYIDYDYLPTFSSHPIENNLHRIPGLSEHFVYFNDDTILTQPVKPEDFFQGGKPLVCSVATPVRNGGYNDTFGHILFGNVGLMTGYDWENIIEKHPELWFNHSYGLRLMYNWHTYQQRFLTGIYYTHMPQAFRKSTLQKVWQLFPNALDETCRHRFRTPLDYSHFIFTLQEIADGDYVPMPPYYYGQINGKDFEYMHEKPETFAGYIASHRFKIICVNDSAEIMSNKYEKIRSCIQSAFNKILPQKSSFEKIV